MLWKTYACRKKVRGKGSKTVDEGAQIGWKTLLTRGKPSGGFPIIGADSYEQAYPQLIHALSTGFSTGFLVTLHPVFIIISLPQNAKTHRRRYAPH